MSQRRRSTALRWLLGVAAAVLLAAPLRAQAVAITLSATRNDSISPAPEISVFADQVPPDIQPASITFEISFEEQFRTPFFVRSVQATSAKFHLDSLLPQRTVVWFRARVLDRTGVVRAERKISGVVHDWVTLDFPNRTTDVLFSRQPQFFWSSPAITLPPGQWTYTVTIVNVGQNRIEEERTVFDTSFVPTALLDACTSYRWSVTARAANGSPNDQVRVNSRGTFVIQARECPSATLYLQPFPNPFGGTGTTDQLCFWFDLAHRSQVTLSVYDVRLRLVKRIVPGTIGSVLDAGPFGRQSVDLQTGCDARLTWDGTDERGHVVPAGVYITVFEADGVRTTHKVLFKGR